MYTQKVLLLDGAMGTMLQNAGLKLGDRPETLSITATTVYVSALDKDVVKASATPSESTPYNAWFTTAYLPVAN